jgi:integrase
LFAAFDDFERAVFGTLLLTGLRKSELYFLTWTDVDFRTGVLSVTGEGKVGFSPKDYEIREVPMPPKRHRDLETAAADRSMGLPQSQRPTSDAPSQKAENVSEAR